MTSAASSTEIAKKILGEPTAPLLLLILAPDEIRKDRFVESLQKQFLTKNSSNLADSLFRYSATDLTGKRLQTFIDEVAAGSLFAPSRFFIVNGIDDLKADDSHHLIEVLTTNLSLFPPGVSLIFKGRTLPSNSVLLKFFNKQGAALTLDELGGNDLTRWVAKELKYYGVIDPSQEILTTLIEIGEGDPDKISKLSEHLALFVDSPQVTIEHVHRLFVDKLSADEFRLLELVTEGKQGAAALLLGVLLRSGKNPFLLLSLISRNFTTFVSVRGLLDKGVGAQEISKILNIPPWLLKKHLAAVRRYTLLSLKHAHDAILRADSKLKNRSIGPESVLGELIESLSLAGESIEATESKRCA